MALQVSVDYNCSKVWVRKCQGARPFIDDDEYTHYFTFTPFGYLPAKIASAQLRLNHFTVEESVGDLFIRKSNGRIELIDMFVTPEQLRTYDGKDIGRDLREWCRDLPI